MSNVAISASFASTAPLEKLAQLMEMRGKWLRESTKDSVIATAIDTLVSLRASTRKAKAKPSRSEVKVSQMNGLVAGWRMQGGKRERCLRSANGNRLNISGRVKWFTKGIDERKLKVFSVKPVHEKIRPYLVVTDSQKSAADFEVKHAGPKRIAKFRQLAKWAFGVAMNKLSTRNVDENGISSAARLKGSQLSIVRHFDSSNSYGVQVSDSLDYAADALRNGRADVDLALKKAANKIAGRMIHRFGDALGKDFTTPFPEVKRRK